jgi:uncharacterized protein
VTKPYLFFGMLFFVVMHIGIAFATSLFVHSILAIEFGSILNITLSTVITILIALPIAKLLMRQTVTSRYLLVVISYIIMQTGLALGSSYLLSFLFDIEVGSGMSIGLSSMITFSLGLVVIIFILYKDEHRGGGLPGEKSAPLETVAWSILGIFLVFATQVVAGLIETYLFGIEPGSDNTADLVDLANQFLPFIFVIAILGPIIEELVFRKAIFGWIYVRTNFLVAGLISSLIFAVIHFDFSHLLIYAAMGFSFAFLYVKTKRIIVPIISHIALNSFVVVVQVLLYDDLIQFMEPAAFIHHLIGLIN